MNIRDLYRKVADFESELSVTTRSRLNCRNGCAQCCKVDLSVFQVEATFIREWFHSLTDSRKSDLILLWDIPSADGDCAFLRKESCTIYEARPLICRSQGMAFGFKVDEAQQVDICPLNDKALEGMSPKEVLNLDLLNLILVQIEQLDASGSERPRVSLRSIQKEFRDSLSQQTLG